MNDFDALLVLSFGGPEGPDDVMPFLRNVVRGRNVPDERLKAVAHHYDLFGGVSPINEQNQRLISALTTELAEHEIDLPIYWGNRNWHPLLEDTMAKMSKDGVKKALAFVTSAYSSYSGCRQYLEDIERARKHVGESAPEIVKIRPYYNHPEFSHANAVKVQQALAKIHVSDRSDVHIAFTAHSIPLSMAKGCDYEAQLQEVAKSVAAQVGVSDWTLVFQSRSGPPSIPWLEPDINDHLRSLKQSRTKPVIIAPIGFVSDHMEVVYDLDTEAAQLCKELEIPMVRAQTVGTNAFFVTMIRELISDHVSGQADKARMTACEDSCCPLSKSQNL